VSEALQKTLGLLAATRNEAATRLLIGALDSSNAAIREGSLSALIARRSPAGEREVLRRLHLSGPSIFAYLRQHCCSLSRALRGALVGSDSQLFINACHEILRTREYDLIPTLLATLEDGGHPHLELASQTLLALVDSLADELRSPCPTVQNPAHARKRAAEALQDSLKRYPRHQRREVVEAFCHLVSVDQPLLLEILGNPHHPAYLTVSEVLLHSQHPAVCELLIRFLGEPQAPSAALTILARRTDAAFLGRMLPFVAANDGDALRRNMRRIELLSWVTGDHQVIDALPEEAQEAAVRMAMASRMNRQVVYAFVAHVLSIGKVAARRTAAEALAEFAGVEANELAVDKLHDSDPEVQIHLVAQLRSRAIPGAIARLLEKLDSPYPEVRQAAQVSLSEFSFDRYLSAFESLDPNVRASTGELVKRVDPNTIPRLRNELQSAQRGRRLRGLAVAEALGLVPDVADVIAELLSDSDGFVRAEAAGRLALADAPAALEALARAAHDELPRVREAAERSLGELRARLQPALPQPVECPGDAFVSGATP
jgi:HEAT repeat protein